MVVMTLVSPMMVLIDKHGDDDGDSMGDNDNGGDDFGYGDDYSDGDDNSDHCGNDFGDECMYCALLLISICIFMYLLVYLILLSYLFMYLFLIYRFIHLLNFLDYLFTYNGICCRAWSTESRT